MQVDKSSNRNKNFYNEYTLEKYYFDYSNYECATYQFLNSQWELALISKELANIETGKVLLIGIGFGREIEHILKFNNKIEVHALDFNENFIKSAGEIYGDRLKLKNFDITKNSLTELNDRYSLILSLNTLEYVDDNNFYGLLNDAKFCMADNAKFIFRILNKDFLFNFIEQRHMRARKLSSPTLYFRRISDVIRNSNTNYIKINHIPLNLRLNTKIIDWAYRYFGEIMWNIEVGLTKILPKKYFSSTYFIIEK